MKREIKKLQRLRDFFRQGINSVEIKDKSRLQEAKRRIEDQMENFRDLEKEYKQKKLTKVAYQNHNQIEGKFKFDSNDDDEDSDGHYNYFDNSDDSDSQEEHEPDTSERVRAPPRQTAPSNSKYFAEDTLNQTQQIET